MAKKIIGEFKAFLLRGNVIDLAVGVIIGGAFQRIVSSVVEDLLMPWVGLLTGKVNFTDQFLILKLPEGVSREQVISLTVAKELGVTTFNYGAFLTAVLNFIIMGFVIFMLVKGINRLTAVAKRHELEQQAAPTTKTCTYCKSEIHIEATRCPHCTAILSEQPAMAETADR